LPAHGGTLDPSSITDNDPEFTLSGEGAAGVTLGAATKVDNDTFRYSFTGAFSAGRVEFLFADGTFKDSSNNTNVGKTDFIQLTDLSADLANPLNGTAVSTLTINGARYIDVTFADTFNAGLDLATITDAGAEFTLAQFSGTSETALPGVSINGAGVLVEGTTATYRYEFSGELPATTVHVKFLAGSWADLEGHVSAAETEAFDVFVPGIGLTIDVTGSVELFLPFVGEDTLVFGVYGESHLSAELDLAGELKVKLGFAGTAEIIYLGNVASTAGVFVLEASVDDPVPKFWGVADLQLNFEKLQEYGIALDASVTLQLNATTEQRIETLTLQGVGPGGTDLTTTYVLDPMMFRLEAGGSLVLSEPAFLNGGVVGDQLFRVDGVFQMEVSLYGMKIFAAGELQFGSSDMQYLSLTATGVLIINEDGVAGDINVDLAFLSGTPLADKFSIDASARLVFNLTGEDQQVTVSQTLLPYLSQDYIARLDPCDDDATAKCYTVPGGAPLPDGTTGADGWYVEIMAEGRLTAFESFVMDGAFRFAIANNLFLVDVHAMIALDPIGAVGIVGQLEVTDEGVLANLQFVAQFSLAGFELMGAASLYVNTTNTPRTIQRYVFDNESETASEDELIDVVVEPNSFGVNIKGKLKLTDSFEFNGEFNLENTSDHFSVTIACDLEMFGQTIAVDGVAAIYKQTDPGLVLYAGLTVENLGIPKVAEVDGTFSLQVNTRTSQHYVSGDIDIPPLTAKIAIDNLDITLVSVLHLTGSASIGMTEGVFEIAAEGTIDLWGVVTVSAGGFIRSNGEFSIAVAASFDWDVTLLEIAGHKVGFNLKAEVDGSISYVDQVLSLSIGGEFSIGASTTDDPDPTDDVEPKDGSMGLAVSGRFELNSEGYVSMTVGIEIDLVVFSISEDVTFTLNSDDPMGAEGFPLAVQNGGTLTLLIGDYKGSRGDSEDKYGVDEKIAVVWVGTDATTHLDTVYVVAFDRQQKYTGVSKIVARGGSGNDRIKIGAGVTATTELYGDLGDDTIIDLGSGPATLDGGDGNDALTYVGPGQATLKGGAGIDLLSVTSSAAAVLYGGDDDDLLRSFGTGAATLHGENGNDRLVGGLGDDTLIGDAGADTLRAGPGDDSLSGGDDDDSLFSGDGNDSISGGAGSDWIDTGDGNNWVAGGTPPGLIASTTQFDGGDHIVGGAGDDEINGGLGDDWIEDVGGNNTLLGDVGNDIIYGGEGIDLIRGGEGDDLLRGGGSNDSLYGDAGNDRVRGGGGNDWASGGLGDDDVTGGAGDDQLFGDEGLDTLSGGKGFDSLWGG
ncbi:MAG TPA: calcium-binding protein, partial [Pirellulaceae bacterium]|nr:calcium-binding protein [Pirellulaceae bacterium]